MRPNVDGAEIFASGAPYGARLKRLKPSARNCKLKRSVSWMRRLSDASICQEPRARARLRPALPHLPFAGIAKAAKLIQRSGMAPPGGVSETPGTTPGLRLVLDP